MKEPARNLTLFRLRTHAEDVTRLCGRFVQVRTDVLASKGVFLVSVSRILGSAPYCASVIAVCSLPYLQDARCYALESIVSHLNPSCLPTEDQLDPRVQITHEKSQNKKPFHLSLASQEERSSSRIILVVNQKLLFLYQPRHLLSRRRHISATDETVRRMRARAKTLTSRRSPTTAAL